MTWPRLIDATGLDLWDQGRFEEAQALFERAIVADPGWSAPYYNLGLMFKQEKDWVKSLEWNLRAAAVDSSNLAAWWNAGIAATALGDWNAARNAWRSFGINVPDGEGPVELHIGPTPIRLDPHGRGEVVWCHRIDPARARIINIPLPESGFFEGDIVLHDGVPNGTRSWNDREVHVLDALELLERSPRRTFIAEVQIPTAEDRDELYRLSVEMQTLAEDWTSDVYHLCKQCSEGHPRHDHDHVDMAYEPRRTVGVSALTLEHAQGLLNLWKGGGVGRRIHSIRPAPSS